MVLTQERRKLTRVLAVLLFGICTAGFLVFPRTVAHGPSTQRALLELSHQSLADLSLLLVVAVLMVTFLCAYVIRDNNITVLHESTIAIALGLIVGFIVNSVTTSAQLESLIIFDQDLFFLYLLPPIIFASGYNMKRRVFFKNFGAILLYAFAGTIINAFVFAGLTYAWAAVFPQFSQLSFLDCLLFGSIISATDPVTVLAIFKQLNVDFNLYAYVFGESVLNDAVAIVLYRTVVLFLVRPVSASSVFLAIGQFLLIFSASLAIGVVVGLWSALLFKWTRLYRHVVLEGTIICLMAYASYVLADGITMSGIVAILFCGVTMAHYTMHNLSAKAREFTREMLEVLSGISETLIFVYLGLAVFTFEQSWNAVFICICIFNMFLARAVQVFPLTLLVNVFRAPKDKIPVKHAIMLWFAGLRGAMAFALSLGVPTSSGTMVMTTILITCIFTVVFLGSLSGKMLQMLDIDMHLDPNLASDDDDTGRQSRFLLLDRKYLKPFFTRLRPRTRVDEEPDLIELEEREFLDFENLSSDGEETDGRAVELRSLSTSTADKTARFSNTSTTNATSTTADATAIHQRRQNDDDTSQDHSSAQRSLSDSFNAAWDAGDTL